MVQPQDLDLVETDVLIEALKRRYDFMIFMGRKIIGANGISITKRRFHGDTFMCVGLCTNLADALNQLIGHKEQSHDGKGT